MRILKVAIVIVLFMIHLGGQWWNATHPLKVDLGEYRLFVLGVIIYFITTHGFDSKYNSPPGEYPRGSFPMPTGNIPMAPKGMPTSINNNNTNGGMS